MLVFIHALVPNMPREGLNQYNTVSNWALSFRFFALCIDRRQVKGQANQKKVDY